MGKYVLLFLLVLAFASPSLAKGPQCAALLAQTKSSLQEQALEAASSAGLYKTTLNLATINWNAPMDRPGEIWVRQTAVRSAITNVFKAPTPAGINSYATIDLNSLLLNFAQQIQVPEQLSAFELVFAQMKAQKIPASSDLASADESTSLLADLTTRLNSALSLAQGNAEDLNRFRQLNTSADLNHARLARPQGFNSKIYRSNAQRLFKAFADAPTKRGEVAAKAGEGISGTVLRGLPTPVASPLAEAEEYAKPRAVPVHLPPAQAHPRADNLFSAQRVAALPVPIRQKAALQYLADLPRTGDNAKLVDAAKAKLPFFVAYGDAPSLVHDLKSADHFLALYDAQEFIVQAFHDVGHGDTEIRQAAIQALGQNLLADVKTIETLLPIARGADVVGQTDFQFAERAIQQIHERLPKSSPDFYLTNRADTNNAEIKRLLGAKVESIRTIDEHGSKDIMVHQNAVYIVTLRLANGEKQSGVFKPALDEAGFNQNNPDFIQFTREVQAHDFFHEYFKQEEVNLPGTFEAVFRFNGKSFGVGSFQLFVENAKTLNKTYLPDDPVTIIWDNPRAFNAQKADPRWKGVEEAIRIFDFAIGNRDRFPTAQAMGNPNNVMLANQPDSPQLAVELIDSGGGRRPRDLYAFGPRDLPPLRKIPADVVSIMRSFDDATIQQIRSRYAYSLSTGGMESFARQLKIEHDYVAVANPFFRPENAYLQLQGLQWHALNVLRSEPQDIPDNRLRDLANEKMGHFAAPHHDETFAHWLREVSSAERTRYALDYALATFVNPATDTEFRLRIIQQLGNAWETSAAEVLQPIASGARSLNEQERQAALAALAKLRAPTLSTTTGMVHNFFDVSPADFQKRLSDLRGKVAQQEEIFGLSHPRGYEPSFEREVQSLRNRLASLKLRTNKQIIADFELSISELEYLFELDGRTTQGRKYLLFARAKTARDINQQKIMTPEQLQSVKLSFKNGLIYDSKGAALDTTGKVFIFVMDDLGNIYATTEVTTPGNMTKHGSFFGGKPAASAGEIEVRNGKLIGMHNSSGNYMPPQAALQQLAQELANKGVAVDPSLIQNPHKLVVRLAKDLVAR